MSDVSRTEPIDDEHGHGHRPERGDGVGGAPLRKEDIRFLTGKGQYSDDVNMPGQHYAAFLRSPYPHATLVSIDKEPALALPGVVCVLTGEDAVAAGIQPMRQSMMVPGPPNVQLVNRDGTALQMSPQPILAIDCVRYVGQPLAVVVATSASIAFDAIELLNVEYNELPHVILGPDAAAPNAPKVWPDAPSNVRLDADVGDVELTSIAMAQAPVRVQLNTWITRVTACPLEPRAAVADFNKATARYVLHAGGGGVHRAKLEIAAILGVPDTDVRVISGDVGGNFGSKNPLYPEYPALLWASRVAGVPVKWKSGRVEAFLSDVQGRDLHVKSELGLDENGKILALRTDNLSNIGAHTASFVPLVKGVELMTSVYDVPVAHVRARGVLSNTPSTYPYRSAGRPEAMFVIERLMDIAAAKLNMDRVEIRRRNLVPEHAMPYTNAVGLTYDSAAFERVMDINLRAAEWDDFGARKVEAATRGMLRGIGLANYIEIAGGNPRERAEITVHPNGTVDLVIGTVSSGQGHETTFAQLITHWLGVPLKCVNLVAGDTDRVFYGGGTQSGRSMRLAGIVVGKATKEIADIGKRVAAHVMQCPLADVAFEAGQYRSAKTETALHIFEIARLMSMEDELPKELRGPLFAICDEVVIESTFPYGCAVCEVEIDPDTGTIVIARYTAVDDTGPAVNPMIVHGQTHGGIAQGVGQALMEQCVYDPASGQLQSASFMDYAMPRADDFPSFVTEISEVPSPSNPLGIRAGGEGGTTPALAVVVNAVVDALSSYGVTHLEMPITAEHVWRVIHEHELEEAL